MNRATVSIVVPCRTVDGYVRDCLDACRRQEYEDFEILLLPDAETDEPFADTRVIATGVVFPSEKRNVAIRESQAEFCAFIDSDACPCAGWLANAIRHLRDRSIGCIGGPNILPPGSSLRAELAQDVLFCGLGVGAFPKKRCADGLFDVKEIPSSNMIARRELMVAVGGFDPSLLTGEDAKVCFSVRKDGFRVVFASDVAVLHHRRPLGKSFCRSIFAYGRDKAFVLKEMFSWDKSFYFIPTLFVLGLVTGPVAWLCSVVLGGMYAAVVAAYLLAVLVVCLPRQGIYRRAMMLAWIPIMHVAYGVGFLWGMLASKASVKRRWQVRHQVSTVQRNG
jgi:GT2 family glycosyltransferase